MNNEWNPEDMLCRVKSPQDNKKWLYGYYWAAKVGDKVNQFIKIIDKDYTTIGSAVINDDTTLCRATAIKDMWGRPIYEGDILKVFADDSKTYKIVKVFWERGQWRISRFSLDLLCERSLSCEIIGNIFDNPNLLEE